MKIWLKEIVFIFVAILLFAVFEYVGWFAPVKNFSSKYLRPVYSFHLSVVDKVRAPFDFISFSFTRSKYMEQIEERYVKSLSELSELDSLREENQELRKLIENRDLKIEKTIITAPIISLAYPAVAAGSSDGVQENNMVLYNGMLVGTIQSVEEFHSQVSLLSSVRKNKVLAKTESGVEGVIDANNKNILFSQVPRNIELVEGERVLAVGQQGIERNTFIGTLKLIDNNPSSPTQNAVVNQDVTFYDIVLVEIK